MPKLNPPAHKTRTIKVVRPPVDFPDHKGELIAIDGRGEYDDEWISATTIIYGPTNPVTGLRVTIWDCIGARPYRYFYATRAEGEWKFKRVDPRKHNW